MATRLENYENGLTDLGRENIVFLQNLSLYKASITLGTSDRVISDLIRDIRTMFCRQGSNLDISRSWNTTRLKIESPFKLLFKMKKYCYYINSKFAPDDVPGIELYRGHYFNVMNMLQSRLLDVELVDKTKWPTYKEYLT